MLLAAVNAYVYRKFNVSDIVLREAAAIRVNPAVDRHFWKFTNPLTLNQFDFTPTVPIKSF